MKVLFLDFDGVISHYKSNFNLDPRKISLIKKIVKSIGCKVVVISSWKSDFDGVEKFKRYNLELIRNKRSNCYWLFSHIYDITENNLLNRGAEIQRYLDLHNIHSYIILDDECDFGDNEELLKHTVSTDIKRGLTAKQSKEVIEKLTS